MNIIIKQTNSKFIAHDDDKADDADQVIGTGSTQQEAVNNLLKNLINCEYITVNYGA